MSSSVEEGNNLNAMYRDLASEVTSETSLDEVREIVNRHADPSASDRPINN